MLFLALVQNFRVFCLGLTSMLISFPAGGADSLSLKLATGDRFGTIVDPKQANGGLMSEKIRRTFALAGYRVEIDFLPWKRAFEMTRLGQYHASFPWMPSPERLKKFIFSKAIYSYPLLTYVGKASPLREIKKAELKNLKTCDVIGSGLKELLPADMPIKLEYVRSGPQCIEMHRAGRLDFGMLPAMMKDTLAPGFHFVPNDFDVTLSLHIMAPRSHPQAEKIIAAFDAAFTP